MSGPPTIEGSSNLAAAPENVAQRRSNSSLQPEVVEIRDDSPEPTQTATKTPAVASLLQSADFHKTHAESPIAISSSVSPSPQAPLQNKVAAFQNDYVAQFQTSFQTEPLEAKAKKEMNTAVKNAQAAFNRTSISSLVNNEDSQAAVASKQPEKKRKTASKAETANKKVKADPKNAAPVATAEKKDPIVFTSVLTPEGPKKEVKKVVKKKTPETASSMKDKLAINPAVTTQKQKVASGPLNLPKPAFLEMAEPSSMGKEGDGKDSAKKAPVIFLDVPLLNPADPKPGQAEVVINVLKLAEDKYGWNAIHPDARSAIDMMDDILDDDDDGEDDEGDDDLQIIEDKKNQNKENETRVEEDEYQKSRKWRAQQTKINRKVGKYDYEDPFIDDEELQWEEEITTTKEGFFVYWGPLVDERSSGSAKKGPGKAKK